MRFLVPDASSLCRWAATLVASVGALLAGVAQAASHAPVAGSGGMVVSAQHLASNVGADVLRRGGNAGPRRSGGQVSASSGSVRASKDLKVATGALSSCLA